MGSQGSVQKGSCARAHTHTQTRAHTDTCKSQYHTGDHDAGAGGSPVAGCLARARRAALARSTF